MAETEQTKQRRIPEPTPEIQYEGYAGGSINLGRLGFIIYSVKNPTEGDLSLISGIHELTVGDLVIRRYLDEHPEEVVEQAPTLTKLAQQIFRRRRMEP